VEKVKRIQLEDRLRSVDEVAVYYDRAALSQEALSAQLDFRRIDVRRSTGFFHPKLVLLLVEQPLLNVDDEPTGETRTSLIIGTLSANLTRSGWWENVETGHFEEIPDEDLDDSPVSFRRDALGLLRRLEKDLSDATDAEPLARIRDFLKKRATKAAPVHNRAAGRHHTRLFWGQRRLPEWLHDLRVDRFAWNLEIISPYFDDGQAIDDLVEAIEPRETRVLLPRDEQARPTIPRALYERLAESGVVWADLPGFVLHRGRKGVEDRSVPRRVHAKVYRLWSRDAGEIVVTGSPNATARGHERGRAGNLEAAFLVDGSDRPRSRQWWLEPVDKEPRDFAEAISEEGEEVMQVPVDVSLRFDWAHDVLEYRLESVPESPLEVANLAGTVLFRVTPKRPGTWIQCDPEAASAVRQLLFSTSFLEVRLGTSRWRVLVREEGMRQRPSLLGELTPEEILLYWSLLTAEQRAAFVEEKLVRDGSLEGLPIHRGSRYDTGRTVFDRFAGLYHAFGRLRGRVEEALEAGRNREAAARLLGAKYDSLPVLLDKVLEQDDADSVHRYVTFLCARQLFEAIESAHPEFVEAHEHEASALREQLEALPRLRVLVPLEDESPSGRRAFFDWYESMFLAEASRPEPKSEDEFSPEAASEPGATS